MYYVGIWSGQGAISVGDPLSLIGLQKLQSGLQLRLAVGGDVKANSPMTWEFLF